MFGFLGIKDMAVAIKYAAILGVVVAILGSLYYISNLKAQLVIERENVKKLELAVETQKQVIDQFKADVAQQQRINKDLQEASEKQRKDMDSLRKRFAIANLNKLAQINPKVVESKINRGSINAVRCFEIASGAPLTEREKNAKTAKDFNPECPSLWTGNKR
jgi:predicted Holliday junction resolvase-like endonuclease